jgi:hypothetical protein
MKKIPFLAVTLLIACTSLAQQNLVSLYSSDPRIAVLNSIPSVPGYEKVPADESKTIDELVQIFDSFADKNKSSSGQLHRGTHAKGQCFRGEVEVFNESELTAEFHYPQAIAERLKQGFFAQDKTWPAILRFANADGFGRNQDDRIPDVRGFSLSIFTDKKDFSGDSKQDFMFNSASAFVAGNAKEFLALVKTLVYMGDPRHATPPELTTLPVILWDLFRPNTGNGTGKNTKSYATQEYWAELPYTHGLDESGRPLDVVKYKVTPCDGLRTQHLKSTKGFDSEYLQQDIRERAAQGQVCLLLQVQFFDYQKLHKAHRFSPKGSWSVTDWIENGGSLWDESILPFYTVARVQIPISEHPETSCQDKYINTRLHATPADQPMGSIARVRTTVEEISRLRRMKAQ